MLKNDSKVIHYITKMTHWSWLNVKLIIFKKVSNYCIERFIMDTLTLLHFKLLFMKNGLTGYKESSHQDYYDPRCGIWRLAPSPQSHIRPHRPPTSPTSTGPWSRRGSLSTSHWFWPWWSNQRLLPKFLSSSHDFEAKWSFSRCSSESRSTCPLGKTQASSFANAFLRRTTSSGWCSWFQIKIFQPSLELHSLCPFLTNALLASSVVFRKQGARPKAFYCQPLSSYDFPF